MLVCRDVLSISVKEAFLPSEYWECAGFSDDVVQDTPWLTEGAGELVALMQIPYSNGFTHTLTEKWFNSVSSANCRHKDGDIDFDLKELREGNGKKSAVTTQSVVNQSRNETNRDY